jgi:ribosomal protein L11 methyltransferase
MIKKEPKYYFVALDVPAEKVDDYSNRLFDMGAQGIEERDDSTIQKGTGGKVMLVASFKDEADAKAAQAKMPKLVSARVEELVGDAWRDAWKAHFKPFPICPEMWIVPPWEKFDPPKNQQKLVLEPGRAFGTGLHESTALVAQILYRRRADLAGKQILDVGTGSGILSLVALKLGASKARGIDTDGDAIEVAKENAQRNKLAPKCTFDTTALKKLAGEFPIVVANIEADVLIGMSRDLIKHMAKGGLLVLSGILETRMRDVEAAFIKGAKLAHAMQKGEWVGLAFELPAAKTKK